MADVYNVITESNESDNSLSVELPLGTCPTCTPSPTAVAEATATFTPTPAFVCADVNGDGTVNVLDLVLTARHLGVEKVNHDMTLSSTWTTTAISMCLT